MPAIFHSQRDAKHHRSELYLLLNVVFLASSILNMQAGSSPGNMGYAYVTFCVTRYISELKMVTERIFEMLTYV